MEAPAASGTINRVEGRPRGETASSVGLTKRLRCIASWSVGSQMETALHAARLSRIPQNAEVEHPFGSPQERIVREPGA
jgi:hypothetical protein